MSLSRDEIRRLLDLLDVTAEEEIDCSELLDRIAGFVERLGPDRAPPPGYGDVVQHLRVCAECCEELEALQRALEEERRRS